MGASSLPVLSGLQKVDDGTGVPGAAAVYTAAGTLPYASGAVVARLPLTLLRNDNGTTLVATSASAGNFLIANTTGTSTGLTGENSTNNSKTNKALAELTLPPTYIAGGDLLVQTSAKYGVTGGTAGATVDVEAFKAADDGTHGSDLCATAAQGLATNSAVKSFTITGASLSPNDKLILRLTTVTTAPTGATANATVNSLNFVV